MVHATEDTRTSPPFDIVALAPWAGVPAIAAAAARAGGIGLIDLEWATGRHSCDDVRDAARWLVDHVGNADRIGVRVRPEDLTAWAPALLAFGARRIVVLLTAPAAFDRRTVPANALVWCEIRATADIAALDTFGACDALVACGNECGGRVADDTTFVLLQRLLALGTLPVYARGGIGVAAAAGCRAVGAHGVVLDDQLLLTAESPLPASWRKSLRGLTGQETVVLGAAPAQVRVFDRPGFAALDALKTAARALDTGATDAPATWLAAVNAAMGWREPASGVWPVGQAVLFAERYQTRHGGTAEIVRHFLTESARRVALAAEQQPFAPGAALGRSHGTTYPIVQGPMTRVSDVPAFAAAVADNGALPLVALAVLTADQARTILDATRAALGDRPWGVGVLGFVPADLKEAQFAEVRRVRPPFALVAGGRPDDAARLEREGIATYLHVPVASLLRRFLAQDARRFVFEGRECGGHVGPLCSLPLWESMVDELLSAELATPSDVHVLFAGGIHDARSAAIVAAMAAPLAARGIRCGVLMGTAYLFTAEAVSTGAITARYQEEAKACRDTVLLVSGVGHANRVAETPFTAEYADTRRALLRSGQSADAVRDALESLTLGRLRLASKGVLRRPDAPALQTASDAEQTTGGIFMLGQVATLRDQTCSMRELHDDVSAGSVADLTRAAAALPADDTAPPHAIAIIGIATLLPGSKHPEWFWRHLLDQTSAITEIPSDRWDASLLYDANGAARDRMNAKWGGFFEDVPFDPVAHRMPPAIMPQICSHQLLALEVTRWALADAGYLTRSYDRSDTAVIVGVAETGGLTGNGLITRTMLPFILNDVPDEVMTRLPEWTGESFTGMLGNVTAGRIANELDMGGANFCIDAACATSLVALDLAAREIREGRSRMAVAATVDTLQTPFGFMAFAKTQALSPTGEARVFDRSADGIVSSEGVAVAILKSLEDARRDGDHVYAVIRGQGTSADGRGLGLTAPAPAGQRRAIVRALDDAGVAIDTIDMYEAHGTGTQLGDRTEAETLSAVLRERGVRPHGCAIGSAKSLIGHTKAAAGMVGVFKALSAIRHRTLPPHAGVTSPIDALADPSCPLAIYDRPRPWFTPKDHPRRAGINAFGFGGTNGSIVLEEAFDGTAAAGADLWPCELFLFAGTDDASLGAALRHIGDALAAGAEPRLRDLAAALAARAEDAGPGPRAAIVAGTRDELAARIALAARALVEPGLALPPQVIITRAGDPGRIAFLFPGQGSQTPHMALDHTLYFDDVRRAIELADEVLDDAGIPHLSERIYPPAAFTPAAQDAERAALAATNIAQPAIGAVSIGVFDLLVRLGVQPAVMAGHSYGELTALHAAGAMHRRDFLAASLARGTAMAAQCGTGTMLAVDAPRERVAALIDGIAGVAIANHNAPSQVGVSGAADGIAAVRARATAAGIKTVPLNVAGPFHSPLMAPAAAPWRDALSRVTMSAPRVPVYSNVTANVHDGAADTMRARLVEQLDSPVEFVAEIERMYADGARTFVEVGPGSVLTRLVGSILGDRPHLAVATDSRSGHLDGLLRAIGTLFAHGIACQPSRLFLGRAIAPLAIDRVMDTVPKPLPATVWWVNGSGPRPSKAPKLGPARESMLTTATRVSSPAPTTTAPRVPAMAPSSMPSIPMPALPSTPGLPASAPAEMLAAYAAYQETMRTFLAVQERVFAACLTAGPAGAAPVWPTMPAPMAVPTVAAPAPTAAAAPATAITPAPAAPAASAALSDDALADRVRRVFAEQTGYPAEMLGLDMDLTADLGIDSIRLVQALGELADIVPASSRDAVAAITDELVRARTIRAILERLRAVAPAASAPATTAAATPATSSITLDRAQLVSTLQQLASERTGYPVELLNPSQDLEGDLGIDSIRRADLLHALVAVLPDGVKPSSEATDRVMRARTIDEIVTMLLAQLASSTSTPDVAGESARVAPSTVAAPARAVSASQSEGPCPSFAPAGGPTSLVSGSARIIDGAVVITEDDAGVAALVTKRLQERGLTAALISRAEASTPAGIAARVASLHAGGSRVSALLHLAPVSRAPMPQTLDAWRLRTQVDVKALYQTLQALGTGDRSVTERLVIVAASMMGGQYGRGGDVGPAAPTGGAAVGLLRCLVREWTGASARAVDFSGTLSAAEIAGFICDELLHDDPHIEVGYPDATRWAFGTSVTPRESGLPDPALRPEAGWVVLSTGGARGITAEAVGALARPGVTIVLASRSPQAPAEAEPADRAALDAAGLRALLLREALARGERPTPVQIDARVTRVLHERDLRAVHARLSASGATIVPTVCDVRDGDAVAALVQHIYDTYGRLDAVIHGAGVIEDALLLNKTPDAFDRVFDTKVDAAFSLARAVRPQGLKLAVFFSSVTGRAGNAGQTDYGAANEVLTRIAWWLRGAWPEARVVSIAWGPWAGTGMAGETIRTRLLERGIEPIEQAAGRALLATEMVSRQRQDVEIVAGIGPWDEGGPNARTSSRPDAAIDLTGSKRISFPHVVN